MIKRCKKLLVATFVMCCWLQLTIWTVSALDDTPYYDFLETGTDDAPEPWEILRGEQSVLTDLLELFGLSSFQDGWNTVFWYITFIINILLWLAWFIALLWLIYGFYRMFFSKEEEWLNRARDILKWAVIALVVIGLSWVITRFIFWVASLFIG
jgi:hypothetical protein